MENSRHQQPLMTEGPVYGEGGARTPILVDSVQEPAPSWNLSAAQGTQRETDWERLQLQSLLGSQSVATTGGVLTAAILPRLELCPLGWHQHQDPRPTFGDKPKCVIAISFGFGSTQPRCRNCTVTAAYRLAADTVDTTSGMCEICTGYLQEPAPVG